MDPAVADQHIGLYVNDFTADLGDDGYAAVRGLLDRAAAAGLVPALAPEALDFP
jgi:1,4-dihydroxy-6-naphthoate synthase